MKVVTFAQLLLFSITAFSQSSSINYKALIKDAGGAVVSNTEVTVQFRILQGAGMANVYQETHILDTDANGIVILNIGEGTIDVIGDYATIDWASNDHFFNTWINTGTGLTDMGTTAFNAVPYAIHASNGQSSGTTTGEMQYWDGTAWITVTPGSTGQVLTYVNGVPSWVGVMDPVSLVVNPTTGRIWMDRNLGATQVATSSTDAASYGDLYQWGRGADGHQLRTSSTTATLSSTDTPGHANFILAPSSPRDWRSPQNGTLWQGVSGVNNPCPAGYRLPTEAELNAERLSWSSNNAAGAYNSPLKLPVAGAPRPQQWFALQCWFLRLLLV